MQINRNKSLIEPIMLQLNESEPELDEISSEVFISVANTRSFNQS